MEISKGLITGIPYLPSPHYNERPTDTPIDMIVLHNISLPKGQFGNDYVTDLFLNQLDFRAHPSFNSLKNLKLSAHLFLRRGGEILQFVPFHKRAWHAGVSQFGGKPDCNHFSIGIELEGCDDMAYMDAQYEALQQLVPCLMTHYPAITRERIVGHSHIAPERKTDPGEAFDWQRLWSYL